MKKDQLNELLLQSLEHEMGGVKVYETALQCAVNDDLKKEWGEYLEQTRNHVRILENVFSELGLDPKKKTVGRQVITAMGGALVQAMKLAKTAGPDAAQLVACECIVLAETKDHLDWELIGECAKALKGKEAKALKAAYDEIEGQEDEHLYHTKGWCRELWMESLGLDAVLPPPEEQKHVKTAIGAARAEKARKSLM
jgi:rubrerythrin